MSKVRGFIKQCSSAGVTTVFTRRIQSTCKTNSRVKKTNAHLSKNLSPRSSWSQASSNYLVSISNCLEETRETEGPWRTKICQNKSQPCNFGVSLWWENAGHCKPPAEGPCRTLWATSASSADPSRSSMGINARHHMTQMSSGMELECAGWGSTLAPSRGSSETGTIWNWWDSHMGYVSTHGTICHALCDYKAQVRTVAVVKGRIRSCRLDERSAHSRDCRNIRSIQKTLHCWEHNALLLTSHPYWKTAQKSQGYKTWAAEHNSQAEVSNPGPGRRLSRQNTSWTNLRTSVRFPAHHL